MIRGALTITRKELACFFFSPIAYMLLFLVSFVTGLLCYSYISQLRENVAVIPNLVFTVMEPSFWIITVLMTPPITMRLIAEEKRLGTLEPLMTAPVTETAVVIGKYLAAFGLYLMLWLPTLIFLLLVVWAGGSFDSAYFITGFTAVVVTGSLFVAIGLFASSIAANQIIAAALAILANFAFLIVPILGRRIPLEWARSFFTKVNYLGMLGDSTEVGVLDTSYLVYVISLAVVFLFFTVRALETRKWK